MCPDLNLLRIPCGNLHGYRLHILRLKESRKCFHNNHKIHFERKFLRVGYIQLGSFFLRHISLSFAPFGYLP